MQRTNPRSPAGRGCARVIAPAVLAVLTLLSGGQVGAGDLTDFNAAVARADLHGRTARFYLLTGNSSLASLELGQMAESWRAVRTGFADDPPAPFGEDPLWGDTLAAVEREIAAARAAATDGDGERGRDALARVRRALGELRARNGVWVFSDCVDEIDRAAVALWTRYDPPPDLTDGATADALRGEIAHLRSLFGDCRGRAPREFLEDPEFLRFIDGSIETLDHMNGAIDEGDANGFGNSLGELRSFARLLFLRFG